MKRIIDAALEIAAALGDRRAAADLLVEISRTIRRRPPPVSFRKRGRPKDSVKYPLTDLARMIGRMEAQHEPEQLSDLRLARLIDEAAPGRYGATAEGVRAAIKRLRKQEADETASWEDRSSVEIGAQSGSHQRWRTGNALSALTLDGKSDG